MTPPGFVYILTNPRNTVLYVGSTSDLVERLHQHRTGFFSQSFTKKYNIQKLVYFEGFSTLKEARMREYQIKQGSRKKKEALVNDVNSEWEELSTKTDFLSHLVQ